MASHRIASHSMASHSIPSHPFASPILKSALQIRRGAVAVLGPVQLGGCRISGPDLAKSHSFSPSQVDSVRSCQYLLEAEVFSAVVCLSSASSSSFLSSQFSSFCLASCPSLFLPSHSTHPPLSLHPDYFLIFTHSPHPSIPLNHNDASAPP